MLWSITLPLVNTWSVEKMEGFSCILRRRLVKEKQIIKLPYNDVTFKEHHGVSIRIERFEKNNCFSSHYTSVLCWDLSHLSLVHLNQ